MPIQRGFLYVAVFLCGAAVLVIELIIARHLSPSFGTTLMVWTAIISVTLAALATGYLAGGWLADRLVVQGRAMVGLGATLGAGAVCCALLPVVGSSLMIAMQGLGLLSGVLVCTVLMLMPTLTALGMVGPYVIRLLTHDVGQSGSVAGRVFALSTLGSILAALATGFFLAPVIGVRGSYLMTAGVLGVLAVAALLLSRQSITLAAAATLAMALTMWPAVRSLQRPVPMTLGESTIVAIDDRSSYGELKIVERSTAQGRERFLLNNGLMQSGMYVDTGASSLPYVHTIAAGLSVLPEGARVVVVGISGGVLPGLLSRMGYQVTAVDIDGRTPRMAQQWFGMPAAVETELADARRYIQTLKSESVDAVILDACTGDREPTHLLTVEALEACRKALKPGGILVLNVLMYAHGTRGLCYAGLIQTMQQAGFQPQAVGTAPQEEYRNTIVFAYADRRPWNKGFRRQPLLKLGVKLGGIVLRDYYLALLNPVEPAATDFPLLYTDDRTALDYLNQTWNHGYRRRVYENVTPAVVAY